MSSEFPSQLHRNIPTTNGAFKRSFEQFGYDSDSSVSGDHNTEASGSSHGTRNATGGSSSTGNDRNKRARSTSSSSSSDDSSTDTSRSTEYDTAESSASLSEGSHSDLDVSPSLNPMATICPPIPNIPTSSASAISQLSSFPETEHHDEMLVDPLVPQNVAHEVTPHLHAPASATPDSLRRSIDRFNEFESEIAALRRSHSNTPTWLPSPPSFPETSLPMDSLNSVSVAEWTTPWLPDPPLQTLNTHRAEYYSGLGVASSRHEDAIPVQISGEDVTSVPEPIVITHSAAQAPDDDSPLNIPPYPPYPSYRPSHRSTSVSESRVSIPPALQPESFISSSSGSRSSDWSATSHSHEAERSPGRESRSPSWWNRIHSRRRSSPAESRVVTSPLPSSESTFSSEPTSTSTSSSRRTSTSMGTPERSRRRIPLSTSIFRSPEPSRPSSPTNDSSDYIMSLFGRRPASRTEPRREQSFVAPWDTEIVERRARPRIEYSRERRFSQVPPAETQDISPSWLSQGRSNRSHLPWHVAHPETSSSSPSGSELPGFHSRLYDTSTRIPSNSLMSENAAEQRSGADRERLRSHLASQGFGNLFDDADDARPSSPTLPPTTSPPVGNETSYSLDEGTERSDDAGRASNLGETTSSARRPQREINRLLAQWESMEEPELPQIAEDLPEPPYRHPRRPPVASELNQMRASNDLAPTHVYGNIDLEPFDSGIFRDSLQRAAGRGQLNRSLTAEASAPLFLRQRSIAPDEDAAMHMDWDNELSRMQPHGGHRTPFRNPFASTPPAPPEIESIPPWRPGLGAGGSPFDRSNQQINSFERGQQSRSERNTDDTIPPRRTVEALDRFYLAERSRVRRPINEQESVPSGNRVIPPAPSTQPHGRQGFPRPFFARGDGGSVPTARPIVSSLDRNRPQPAPSGPLAARFGEQPRPRIPSDDQRSTYNRLREHIEEQRRLIAPQNRASLDNSGWSGEDIRPRAGASNTARWRDSDDPNTSRNDAWGDAVSNPDAQQDSVNRWRFPLSTPAGPASNAARAARSLYATQPTTLQRGQQNIDYSTHLAGRTPPSTPPTPASNTAGAAHPLYADQFTTLPRLQQNNSDIHSNHTANQRSSPDFVTEQRRLDNMWDALHQQFIDDIDDGNPARLARMIAQDEWAAEQPAAQQRRVRPLLHVERPHEDSDEEEEVELNPPSEPRRGFPYRSLSLLGRLSNAANGGPSRPTLTERLNQANERNARENAAQGSLGGRIQHLRNMRQRLQHERNRGSGPIWDVWPSGFRDPRRTMGDYMPDEMFDSSYEGLLSLSEELGEVRSKATSDDAIASLPTAQYKDWATKDSETRCPICLDDYGATDTVAKLPDCPHWLHKACLEQWLHTANTCPVCRNKVKPPSRRICPRRYDSNHDPSSGAGGSGQGNAPGPSGSSNQNRAGPGGSHGRQADSHGQSSSPHRFMHRATGPSDEDSRRPVRTRFIPPISWDRQDPLPARPYPPAHVNTFTPPVPHVHIPPSHAVWQRRDPAQARQDSGSMAERYVHAIRHRSLREQFPPSADTGHPLGSGTFTIAPSSTVAYTGPPDTSAGGGGSTVMISNSTDSPVVVNHAPNHNARIFIDGSRSETTVNQRRAAGYPEVEDVPVVRERWRRRSLLPPWS